jgi:hypothetical protein
MKNDSPKLKRSWWRFSIREIMLLTAAIAGFLAWSILYYQRSRPYERTSIPDRLSTMDDVQTICAKLGYRPSSYSAGGGGSSGFRSTTRTYDCRIDLAQDLRQPFMQAYREHVRRVLWTHASDVSARGTTSDGRVMRDFEFEYTQGRTRGFVAIRSTSSDKELALFIFIHEHGNPP